jgi:hypothetical protein
MRKRLPRAMALPVTAAVLLLVATPALAQEPTSAPTRPQSAGHAVGDAGSALGLVRLLPAAVPTSAAPADANMRPPKQTALEAAVGLSSAQANSEAGLAYEKAIAQSSPFGSSVGGNAPQAPGSLVQTAMPDNPQPITGGLNGQANPLLNVGLLHGSAHARWSETLGPCVDTIADAGTSVASVSMLSTIPLIPGIDQLTNADRQLRDGLKALPGPLANLGGLLSGTTTNADGTGAVLSLPDLLSSRSVVKLVDIPNSNNKAVRSTSTLQATEIDILKGTPLGLTIKVVSPPSLTVTSTGDEKTSKVSYVSPVLQVMRGNALIFQLDAQNPAEDIPIGIPLPALKDVPGFGQLKNVPIIGGLAEMADGSTKQLPAGDAAKGLSLDLAVLKLSIGGLDEKGQSMTDPFNGYELGASARLFDLQILPTTALKNALPADAAKNLPSSLAQLSVGEQVVRAYAPADGVVCGTAPVSAPADGAQAPGPTKNLAYTSGAYDAVPMFWTGTAMLLVGVIVVAALPRRRRKPEAVTPGTPVKPSPGPRP